MNSKLEAALAYSRMRWRIFPCHSVVNGTCSCGKINCFSPGKHPRSKKGFKDATHDEATIRRWWTKYPDANIALATGDGIVVFDIDGEEGFREFAAFVAAHGRVPETLTSQTGRGAHLLFATRDGAPSVRSAARGKVHVRGDGGYIILPPSDHISGRNYRWIKNVPLAILPDSLRQWAAGYEVTAGKTSTLALGPLPAYLQTNQPSVTETLSENLKTAYSPAEHARLVSALAAIPSNNYEIWFQVGMALKTLDWERSDGTSIAFDLFDSWSQTCPDKYSLAATEAKWNSFGRRAGITLGTVFHLAQQHGWNGGLPPVGASPASGPQPGMNGHANGAAALPAAFLAAQQGAIFFPDLTEEGKVRSTMLNSKVAIGALGVDCRYDLFHNRMLVAGELISKWNSTELSDHITTMLRDVIRFKFGFDPGKQNVQDACEAMCLARRFDPVLDYLDGLAWDGRPRLDNWLATYMQAPNNEYTRAVARLSLIAAVRRARKPATKFDQIIVLEGKQGRGKSEALRILAGPENFSDQKILGVDDRKQQELTEGVWLYEIAELTGLRRAEIEHVKAFVSRTVDRARPAYGRYTINQPRRTIFFGSTNQDVYLQDDTGNRRFWPVPTGRVDLTGLARDRDQLWAEAASREKAGESHVLPEQLWLVAGEVQDSRAETDEWEELINNYLNLKGFTSVSLMQVLTDNQFLQLRASDIGHREQSRAARALRKLGFNRRRVREGKDLTYRYVKP